ncbi:chromate efflux transporter [Serratia sp. JSRIV001]|uniref:chromate efflux transporter n=1 Tax=unclassified Serratia (in: enterobacteria) TaxID=2647522 RepID=UPI001CBE1094|nr:MULTISPECIES: chromate efflux transporter [unclassified Serratia (in: enterobacteria)]UAN45209.1 chromate efflux transporter [Serratia sp. JSRIV001]UAN54516.1 chromate efflux transporter [Serratia sp. JSRIV002]UAN60528.1 chromate efflux transporter [Serratia sp. JSRIV004]
MSEKPSLWSLFCVFLRIGSTAFGGFMALIAVVENQVVERRKWMKSEEFLDGLSLATVLMGAVAVNTVVYVGYRLRGGTGVLVSMLGIILPSFFLMLILTWAYLSYGSIPTVSKLFMGCIPAVAAIILVAALNMGKKAILGRKEAILTVIAAALMISEGSFWMSILVIVGSGVSGIWLFRTPLSQDTFECPSVSPEKISLKGIAVASLLSVPFLAGTLTAKLFLTFAGMSLLLFGGAYAFIPLIHQTVVETNGWLTQQEFVDAIAMSQIMPGPIVLSTVFIGYKLAGVWGAMAATVGIFLPPALLMVIATSYLNKIKTSLAIKAVLKGVRPAVIGMIVSAVVAVGATAPYTGVSVMIFGTTLFTLLKFKLDVVWIIPTAGLLGLLAY